MRLYTIGHSTLPARIFVERLHTYGVRQLADVRRVPRSRRHAQFDSQSLAATLRAAGIDYRHFPALGGWRRPRPDSPNTAWQRPGFRGYADYMLEPAFDAAVQDLVAFAAAQPTAIM